MPHQKSSSVYERSKFFRGLHILVSGTKHAEHSEKVNLDVDTEKFRKHWNNMIWLELQAWQNNKSVRDYDSWLVHKRLLKIPKVIDCIENFQFEATSTSGITDAADFLQVTVVVNPEEPKEFLRNSFLVLSNQYFETCFDAYKQVLTMLKDLSSVEQLFSSSANLAIDFPMFGVTKFQQKIDLICMWYNTAFELLHNFSSVMEMLGLTEYKAIILSVLSQNKTKLHPMQLLDESFDEDEYVEDSFEEVDSDQLFSDAITKMTSSYLRKHKVQSILSLLLCKHLACLIRSHEMLERNYSFSEKWNRNRASGDVSALLDAVMDLLPNVNISSGHNFDIDLPNVNEYFGLPDLQPLYCFVRDFIFTIMGECLTLRLDQAQECQKQCGSTTSLLTVQQVVTECKEVIQCSLLSLTFHLALSLPISATKGQSHHGKLMVQFKAKLKQMFYTYLDFVEMWIIALLTGLPHAPRNFLETLHSEWEFVKEASADINMMSCIPCSCKFVDICKQIFLTTQEFLEAASSAICLSKNENENCAEDIVQPPELSFMTSSYRRNTSTRLETPTSPQAGVLWFHRQRSESPHLARHHSISYTHTDSVHLPVQSSVSAPLLFRNVAMESHRRYLFELCRAVRDLFEEARERSSRAVNFAKTLRKDLESSTEFSFTEDDVFSKKNVKKIVCRHCALMQKIFKNGFVNVDISWNTAKTSPQGFHPSEHLLFVTDDFFSSEQTLARNGCDTVCKHRIIRRLVSCFTSSLSEVASATSNGVFIIVKRKFPTSVQHSDDRNSKEMSHHHRCGARKGPIIYIDEADLTLTNIDLRDLMANDFILSHDVTAIAVDGKDNARKRMYMRKLFGDTIQLEVAQSSVVRRVQSALHQLHDVVLSFSSALVQQIDSMGKLLQNQVAFDRRTVGVEDEEQMFMEVNRVVQKNYNIGFEYLNDTIKILSGEARRKMEEIQLSYLKRWMDYVMQWLPRGKGSRPRWATHGLNFLSNLSFDLIKRLSDEDYNELKQLINTFIDHVVGARTNTRKIESTCDLEAQANVYRSLSSNSRDEWQNDVSTQDRDDEEISFEASGEFNSKEVKQPLPMEGIRRSIDKLEASIRQKKLEDKVVGAVVDTPANSSLVQLSIRSVNFQWQRGNKIGEGSFGRVYTCVNMDSGKILAMKEISFQPHDEQHIKAALDEITNFEGISHPNLVKYYGVEIHRDQMFIFMDFCDAGTLEEVSRLGLPEVMIQQYTAQLVIAVSVLHGQGFVHRDIKGSNIFLTTNGLLKLGDFGSAVRLLNRTKTLAGEVASHHGITPAYTAPEVINSVKQRGYGRSADIWSIGCVVIEMTTGKRPWHDLDPFQILYKVGMGSKPAIPTSLSQDGQTFIEHCLEVDTAVRWNINDLQSHPFVKVAQPEAASLNGR